jgi:hypothetical protein
MEDDMALVGTLWVDNKTNKILKVYQGPKHKNYRGAAGPKSWAGFAVNDPHGNTYFRATPTPESGGGRSYDLVIPRTPVAVNYTWTIK